MHSFIRVYCERENTGFCISYKLARSKMSLFSIWVFIFNGTRSFGQQPIGLLQVIVSLKQNTFERGDAATKNN